MVEKTQSAGALVTALFQAFEHGSNSISAVPGLIKQVIREEAWKEYSIPHSSVVHKYNTFSEFAEKVLRASIDALEKLCRDDPEALVMLRQVTVNPVGTNQHNDNIITQKSEQGTSKAYSLDKLKRDKPELYQKVVAGELSANKAMVEAGFRHKTFTIRVETSAAIRFIKKHFSTEEQYAIFEAVLGNIHEQKREN